MYRFILSDKYFIQLTLMRTKQKLKYLKLHWSIFQMTSPKVRDNIRVQIDVMWTNFCYWQNTLLLNVFNIPYILRCKAGRRKKHILNSNNLNSRWKKVNKNISNIETIKEESKQRSSEITVSHWLVLHNALAWFTSFLDGVISPQVDRKTPDKTPS